MHCICHHGNTHYVPQDEDLKRTHQLFADVGNEKYPETDISAEQWLCNKGASSKVMAIADACYANDFGCTLHQLGLREMITENRKWDSGTGRQKKLPSVIAISSVVALEECGATAWRLETKVQSTSWAIGSSRGKVLLGLGYGSLQFHAYPGKPSSELKNGRIIAAWMCDLSFGT